MSVRSPYRNPQSQTSATCALVRAPRRRLGGRRVRGARATPRAVVRHLRARGYWLGANLHSYHTGSCDTLVVACGCRLVLSEPGRWSRRGAPQWPTCDGGSEPSRRDTGVGDRAGSSGTPQRLCDLLRDGDQDGPTGIALNEGPREMDGLDEVLHSNSFVGGGPTVDPQRTMRHLHESC